MDCQECFLHVGIDIINTADRLWAATANGGGDRVTRDTSPSSHWLTEHRMCKELAQGADARLRPGIGGGIGIQVGEGGRHPGCLRSTHGAPWVRRVRRASPGGAGVAQERPAVFIIPLPTYKKHSRQFTASQSLSGSHQAKLVLFFTL